MKNYLKIAASMLIWSTWGLIIRWMALPPVVVLFHTSLIAGLIVPFVLKARGDFPHGLFGFSSWHLFAALAAASIANNITYFFALGHTTVANAVFTHYTAPVLVAALAPFIIAERLQRVTLVSLPLAAVGMTMIVLAGGGISLTSADLPGILAGTASGVAYAFVIIYSRRLSQMLLHHKAIILLLWTTVIATAPFVIMTDYSLSLRTAALLAITGIMHSTTAPLMYFNALRKVLAQHAAILGYIEPLAAIPLAFLFLSEKPPLSALLGGVLIIVSGYLVVHERPADPA